MKLGKILEGALKVAAPVAAGAVAGPEVGALVAAGLGAGAGGKAAGKAVEAKTGIRAQKILGPLAAVAVPALLTELLDPSAMDAVCKAMEAACAHPGLLVALPGILAILTHDGAQNVAKTAGK